MAEVYLGEASSLEGFKKRVAIKRVLPHLAQNEAFIAMFLDEARLSDEHLANYDPSWTDEVVREWDGNFRSDGALMLVCCERDIDVLEFRQALHEHLRHRLRTVQTR